MARLYWRVKKHGRWTWKPAKVDKTFATIKGQQYVVVMEEEE